MPGRIAKNACRSRRLPGALRLIALSVAFTICAPLVASAALLSSCSLANSVDAPACTETVTSGLGDVEFTDEILPLEKWPPLSATGLFPALTDVKVGGTFPVESVESDVLYHAGTSLPHPAKLGVSQLFTFGVGRDASSAYLASPAAATPTVDPLRFVSLDGAVFPIAETVTLASRVALGASSLDWFAGISLFKVSGSTLTVPGDSEEAPTSATMLLITLIYGSGTERIVLALLSLALLLSALAGLGLLLRRRRGAMR